MTKKCGYTGCPNPAVYAGRTTVPDKPVYRCAGHAGHHDFTHWLRDGQWVAWMPDGTGLEQHRTAANPERGG